MTRFLGQPCRRYLAFQLVFAVLALNFILPALTYSFRPDVAVAQYLEVNSLLGGAPYAHHEGDSRLWRYLGAANVMTLGFMCVLLMVNLRRFYMVLWPLAFMKLYATLSWAAGFVNEPTARVFLAAAVLDGATSAAFVFFATRAHTEILHVEDDVLVPRPWWPARHHAHARPTGGLGDVRA